MKCDTVAACFMVLRCIMHLPIGKNDAGIKATSYIFLIVIFRYDNQHLCMYQFQYMRIEKLELTIA